MRLPRRALTLLIALTTFVGLSGIALAEHENAKEDTNFSFGYDEANQALIINSGPNNALYECSYENGQLTTTYGDAGDDGIIPVDGLEDEAGPKEFDPTDEHELDEDLEPADAPYAYDGADGECGATATSVAGPNGQVNHGQFMKAFKRLINMKGHGCLNRIIAQSDLGKSADGTKVNVSDVDPDFEIGETGEVTFLSFEADCAHGKNDPNFKHGAEAASANLKAKAVKEKTKGKSAQAPGRNK